MRRLTMALVIGSALATALPAGARTPGAVCRQECRPRVLEQCAGLTGAEKRRCRRPLIRACKATTPAIACPSTEDLTRELGDQRLAIADGDISSLTLCASGSFKLADRASADPGQGLQIITERSGTWEVAIVDRAPAIVFTGDDSAQKSDGPDPLPIDHDATGALLVGGQTAQQIDAAAACAEPADGPDQPDPDDLAAARVAEIARAVSDRALQIEAPDGDPNRREELQLCSSGRMVQTFVTAGQPSTVETFRGTWTIGSSGTLVLTLDSGSTVVFGVEVEAGGDIRIDDAPVQQRDVRAACADLDLAARFTTALEGHAFFFVQAPNVLTTLGLCDTGRYAMRTGTTQVGEWRVRASGGVATIAIQPDGQSLQGGFDVAFDADGNVTVEGAVATDDPIVDLACQS
ncbi:MAG TPA: hypothetical protein VMS22_19735 [Candidatus Eisenbacteria bacterium]|nr:hypothetical protein [Candidatus Eisenbacteria bacterium]